MRLPKATGITRDITIGITVRTIIGIPAATTGRTIDSTGIGGTVGIMAGTMVLIGERTTIGMAVRIITIIDDKGTQHSVRSMIFAESVAAQRPFNVQAIGTARYFDF